jgi:hypothetical protein
MSRPNHTMNPSHTPFAVAGCFIYPNPTICEGGYLTVDRLSLNVSLNYERPATTPPRPGAGEPLELIAQSSVNTVILLSLLLPLPTGLDLAPCQWDRRVCGGSVGRGSGWWSSRRSVDAPAWEVKDEWRTRLTRMACSLLRKSSVCYASASMHGVPHTAH